MTYVSKIIIFLIYELGKIGHRQFCKASFTASFYDTDKLLKICFKTNKLIIQIWSGSLGHPLFREALSRHYEVWKVIRFLIINMNRKEYLDKNIDLATKKVTCFIMCGRVLELIDRFCHY